MIRNLVKDQPVGEDVRFAQELCSHMFFVAGQTRACANFSEMVSGHGPRTRGIEDAGTNKISVVTNRSFYLITSNDSFDRSQPLCGAEPIATENGCDSMRRKTKD